MLSDDRLENRMREVSPGNPCPFLRALVAQEYLDDGTVPLGTMGRTLVQVAATGEGSPRLPEPGVRAIALIANGLGPQHLVRAVREGVRLDELRHGPLDKQGAGSGILDVQAGVVPAELERLGAFASEKTRSDGTTEQGLDLAEITRFMDANYERAAGRRRRIDRRLMNGEWPVLLRVLGREGTTGRYLALDDVRRLVVDRQLPQRMTDQLA
ncbi:MAG TPA: hypothetical protein VI248_17735 [Kineosporiaceae bacterium]